MSLVNVLFIMVASILVFFMTPGLALFYGGLVPKKNMVNTFIGVFFICGLASLLWVVIGYSLSFSGQGPVVGNLKALMMYHLNLASVLPDSRIPLGLYALYQMMFAIITPALFIGAIVGRVRLPFLAAFIIGWSVLIYYPLVHMVWGGGFLQHLGTLDFAGGTVVHINAGVTAFTLSLLVGPRLDRTLRHDNQALVLIGTSMLWLGWYGFNAGSALAINEIAVQAMLTTTVATAGAMVAWQGLELIFQPHVTLVGTCTGALCGLVAITPATGYVTITGATLIGIGGAIISYLFVRFIKPLLKVDDTLDAFGCHGISGIWGSIATGLFATHAVNPAVVHNGLFYGGGWQQFLVQIGATAITMVYTFVMVWILYRILSRLLPVRMSARDEVRGWRSEVAE
ncbi:ammonium transporter [Lactobacillus sp. 3B(2020)]|uniref:ammonium transporter n=1 Tax=Lactobacillus sp. 3B(2020) TaxID=2695882 RepID=UPI0015DF4912|nr:ammonium transporter [Lactobacillus sp. 3B(2020)]QLL70104.1 ammonium transporter [Lactobacillus sp. 3B(2020)]